MPPPDKFPLIPINKISHSNPDLHLVGDAIPAPSSVTSVGTASVGDSPYVAREDHSHGIDTTSFFTARKGTVFPVGPLDGDIYYRTDIGRYYIAAGGLWYRLLAGTGTGIMGFDFTRAAALNVPNTTWTDIPWDTELRDSENTYAVPITNLGVPTDRSGSGTTHVGDWNLGGRVTWSAAPGALAMCQIINNSTAESYTFDFPNTAVVLSHAFTMASIRLDAGNSWKIRVYQNSGAARTITGKLWGRWRSP